MGSSSRNNVSFFCWYSLLSRMKRRWHKINVNFLEFKWTVNAILFIIEKKDLTLQKTKTLQCSAQCQPNGVQHVYGINDKNENKNKPATLLYSRMPFTSHVREIIFLFIPFIFVFYHYFYHTVSSLLLLFLNHIVCAVHMLMLMLLLPLLLQCDLIDVRLFISMHLPVLFSR